jgi:hypothetical protein
LNEEAVNGLVDCSSEASSLRQLGTEQSTAVCPGATDFSGEHPVSFVEMEEHGEGDKTDILKLANGVAKHRWSSLQLCLATSFTQVVFRNNDGSMIASDHAVAAFLGEALVFGHHKIVVELLCGGVSSEREQRRREVDALRGNQRGNAHHLPSTCVDYIETSSDSFPCSLTAEAKPSRHDLRRCFDLSFGGWKCSDSSWCGREA